MSDIYIHPTVFHDCRRLRQLQHETGASGWSVDHTGRAKLIQTTPPHTQWPYTTDTNTPDGAA